MKVLTIAWFNIVRLFRDRQGLVFVFAMPIAIIVVFGLAFGGQGVRELGIANADEGALSAEIVAMLDDPDGAVEIRAFGSPEALRDAVQHNRVDLGIVIPDGFDPAVRNGGTATVEFVARPGEPIGAALRPLVDDVLRHQAVLVKAARFAMAERGIGFDEALAEARRHAGQLGAVSVRSETTAEAVIEPGMNGYLMGAQSQLVMFIFMISMTAAAQLIATRQLGISRRMYASPTPARTIILGEALGRFAVAMIQGLFIFLITAIVFGVEWGDPLAATLVLVAFALVSSGAAMLIGSIAQNPEQASSIGVGRGDAACGVRRGDGATRGLPRHHAHAVARDAARLGDRRVPRPDPARQGPARHPAAAGGPRRLRHRADRARDDPLPEGTRWLNRSRPGLGCSRVHGSTSARGPSRSLR